MGGLSNGFEIGLLFVPVETGGQVHLLSLIYDKLYR